MAWIVGTAAESLGHLAHWTTCACDRREGLGEDRQPETILRLPGGQQCRCPLRAMMKKARAASYQLVWKAVCKGLLAGFRNCRPRDALRSGQCLGTGAADPRKISWAWGSRVQRHFPLYARHGPSEFQPLQDQGVRLGLQGCFCLSCVQDSGILDKSELGCGAFPT